MPSKKFTWTAPDGTKATRTSKTREYTHVVVISPATQDDRRRALNAQADALEAEADRLEAAAVANVVKIRNRGFNLPSYREDPDNAFSSHEIYLVGTETKGSRHTYPLIQSHANHKGEVETWPKYAEGLEPIRETGKGLGEQEYAYPGRAYLVAKAHASAASGRAAAARLRAEAEQPDPQTSPGVIRWSSRRDLAEKALSEFDYERERYGRTAHVEPVD